MSLLRPSVRALTMEQDGWLAADTLAPLNAERALSVVPVYAAVRLISETLASFPVHAYVRTADGRRRTELPAFLASPVDGSTAFEWLQRGAVSTLLQGNAYGFVTGLDRAGWPTGVQWVNPGRVRCAYESGSVRPAYWLDGRRLEHWQMVHVPAVVVPGKADGINPVRAFATTFDAARETQAGRRDWAKNRQLPGSILQNVKRSFKGPEADAVAARAEQKIRNGKVLALGSEWKYDVVTLPSQDVAFLESVKADANMAATIYTVPPELIGGSTGSSLTYSTVEGQFNWILTMTTRSWVSKFEGALSRLMPPDRYIKLAVDSAVRTDVRTRFDVYKIARDIGLRNVDELRELEDLPPLPDGQGASYAPLAVTTKQTDPQAREAL